MVMPVACAAAETVGDVMDALQGGCAAGLTPLHLAVRTGSADLVRCRHSNDARVDRFQRRLLGAEARNRASCWCNLLT
jgi:hypothetical protein